jgi:hypothetical protein
VLLRLLAAGGSGVRGDRLQPVNGAWAGTGPMRSCPGGWPWPGKPVEPLDDSAGLIEASPASGRFVVFQKRVVPVCQRRPALTRHRGLTLEFAT